MVNLFGSGREMKILIACECSGRVRDAFIKKGHDAVSCDILPTELPGPHIQGDVLEALNNGWDMMIGHPPCTFLSYAGTRCWNRPGRLNNRLKALEFFAKLWQAPIDKICLENPKGCASPTIAKYSQSIQPYFFGDPASKETWLWLKNLPHLKHYRLPDLFGEQTHVDKGGYVTYSNGESTPAWYANCKRGDRSKTFQAIADAMAEQWR